MSVPPLEHLLADQGRSLRRLAAGIVRDEHLAEDVAQEAWLRGQRRPGAPAAWWTTVARGLGRNLVGSRSARRAREQAVARREETPSVTDELERAELATRLARAVAELPDSTRRVVVMRFWDGLPPREIARRTGTPLATVKSQLHRGLTRLRADLSHERGGLHPGLAALAVPAPGPFTGPLAILMQLNLKVLAGVAFVGALGLLAWRLYSEPQGLGPTPGVSRTEDAAVLERDVDAGSREAVAVVAPDAQTDGPARRAAAPGEERLGAEAVILRGRVVDGDGAPVVGATLQLLGKGEYPGDLTTDADGRYLREGLEPGSYRLKIQAVGCLPWRGDLNVPAGHREPIRDLVLTRGRSIHGRVLEEGGGPVAGARLFVVTDPGKMMGAQLREVGVTDTAGGFELLGAPLDPFRLAALAEGRIPVLTEVPPNLDDPLEVRVQSGWGLRVVVNGAATAAVPLQLKVVPATGSRLADDDALWRVHTQREPARVRGTPVQIGGLVPGEPYYLELFEPDPQRGLRRCAEVQLIEEGAAQATLEYAGRARVSVSAVDAVSGGPVSRLELFVRDDGYWGPSVPADDEDARRPGRQELLVPSGVPIEIGLSAPGYRLATVGPFELEPGEVRALPEVSLEPVAAVRVEVRDLHTGAALEGVRLRAEGEDIERILTQYRERFTDAQGSGSIAATAAGMVLHVEHPGYTQRELPMPAPGASLRVDLEPCAVAVVQVLDARGEPVVGASVEASTETPDAPTPGFKRTDHEGRVLFDALVSGEYAFRLIDKEPMGRRLRSGGALATIQIQENRALSEDVSATVAAGEVTQVRIEVPAHVRVTGRVLAGGAAQSGVGVHIVQRPIGLDEVLNFVDLGEPEATTDKEGRFQLDDVQGPRVALIAQHPARRFPTHHVLELGAEDAYLELHLKGASLRGQVTGAGGAPLAGAEVRVAVLAADGSRVQAPRVITMDAAGVMTMQSGDPYSERFEADAEGRFAILDAPPEYTLQVTVSAPRHVQRVEERILADGEDARLDLELAPAGALELRLSSPSGDPVRNHFVALEWLGSGKVSGHEGFQGNEPVYHRDGLTPGPWEVRVSNAMGGGDPTVERFDVLVGEVTGLDMTVGE